MKRSLLLVGLALAGCMPAAVNLEPGPTRIAPLLPTQVEVVWENRSDRMYVVSITGRADAQRAFAHVEPCSAHNVIQQAGPPFEIGLIEFERFEHGPAPAILHSDELAQPPGGLYRILVRIDAAGAASAEPIAGREPWEPRSFDDC